MSAPDNTSNLAAALGYMTEADLIALAGITESTAAAWRKRGTGPASTRFGTTHLYRIDAVASFLKLNEKPNGQQRTDAVKGAL